MGSTTSNRPAPAAFSRSPSPPLIPSNAFPAYPPVSPYNPAAAYGRPLSAKEQKKLADAYRTIRSFQRTPYGLQRPGSVGPISSPPSPTFNNPPIMNISQPPSPALQRAYGLQPSSYGSIGYRDTDYAAVANISGLNPADIALLHREYVNLTRGGRNKLDRVVFRQILRDVLIEANNENIDRALENIFVSIDRNHDGFIDFPEFVGAFRDVLKADPGFYPRNPISNSLQELLNEHLKPNYVCTPAVCQPASQVISLPATGVSQQAPIVYGGPGPLVIPVDANQQFF